jgi:hypothetical protein
MTTIPTPGGRRTRITTHVYSVPVVQELTCLQPDEPPNDPRRDPPGRSTRRGRAPKADRSQPA